MPSRQRLLEKWNFFRQTVLPSDVGEIQLTETRRAFFAGAASCFDIVAAIDKDTTEEQGCAVLDDLANELESHLKRMLQGTA